MIPKETKICPFVYNSKVSKENTHNPAAYIHYVVFVLKAADKMQILHKY